VTTSDLTGDRVALLPIRPEDVGVLREIRASSSVHRWWGAPETPDWPFGDDTTEVRSVWHDDRVIGFVQWYENADARYRHAGIDLFLAGEAQGRGLGRETVTVVVDHLVRDRGHHRIVIDPAAANERAIACYTACGFRAVGTMRRYERDVDGDGWHDGLLMELVVDS
jgi:aminoglycoside 6'-N-acetyltransferase